jgi:hypothetical protein
MSANPAVHGRGSSFDFILLLPQKICSGWVGVYCDIGEEARLLCVLLPGDIIAHYPGCFTKALTDVRTEPCEMGSHSVRPFIQQTLRLTYYNAVHRLGEFLFDAYTRLERQRLTVGSGFELPLNQREVGELLGLSAVHINRSFKALRPFVRYERRRIFIDDLEGLTQVLGHSSRDDDTAQKAPPEQVLQTSDQIAQAALVAEVKG